MFSLSSPLSFEPLRNHRTRPLAGTSPGSTIHTVFSMMTVFLCHDVSSISTVAASALPSCSLPQATGHSFTGHVDDRSLSPGPLPPPAFLNMNQVSSGLFPTSQYEPLMPLELTAPTKGSLNPPLRAVHFLSEKSLFWK